MLRIKFSRSLTILMAALILFGNPLHAEVTRSLPLPGDNPSANEIIDQVYYINHFFAFDNFSVVKKDGKITVLVNKFSDKRPTTITMERYLNNNYQDDAEFRSKDLAIFRSGKLRGTGMLISDFSEAGKSQSYAVWIPALRKIRRFAQPAHDDAWGGTDFTFGDVTLRKPEHETHELQGKETFKGCLGTITLADNEKNKYTRDLPAASCVADGKQVYKVRSTTKFDNWWYDYRISYIDTQTFADYRTDYYKGDKHIKVIDRDWKAYGDGSNPRKQVWGYWYGKTLANNHETLAIVPPQVISVNDDSLKESLWSERTLRRIRR